MSKMNKRMECVAEKTVKIVEKPIPPAPPKGMVVKIHYAGVCHSDVHLWLNKFRTGDNEVVDFSAVCPNYTFPRVLGHEIAGEVFSLGTADSPGAPKFAVGDLVLVYPWTGCGTCNCCTRRKENLCDVSANHAYGVGRDGGYQAYLSVETRCHVQHLPAGIPMETACLLTCSALTAYNANRQALQSIEESIYLNDGARVLVVGAGGLGLWGVRWAKALYPSSTRVFVADVAQDKLDNAKTVGADGGVLWERGLSLEDLKKRTMEVCGGEIDVAFDFFDASSTAKGIQACLRRGGCHVMIGLAGGTLPLSIGSHAMESRQIRGNYVGTSKEMEEMAKLVGEKKVVPPPVSIHKPEEAGALLEQLHAGTLTGRAVLKFI